MRFLLRACSACGGELELKQDVTGPYVECVRCGLDQETLRPSRRSIRQARLVAARSARELAVVPPEVVSR